MGQARAHFRVQGTGQAVSLVPFPKQHLGVGPLLTGVLLTGRRAAGWAPSAARPDEPGPGDSAGPGERLEKCQPSHCLSGLRGAGGEVGP